MRKFRKHAEARRGFTLVEMLVAMVIGTILIMGMGTVLVTLFSGMRESKDFGTATGRVDLIRQLTFDARTGDEILFPAVGADGDYASGGNEGDQVQFNSLEYDPGTDTTTTVTVTWESRRPGTARGQGKEGAGAAGGRRLGAVYLCRSVRAAAGRARLPRHHPQLPHRFR